MSAEVFPGWNVSCADCAEAAGPFDYADDAEEWVANHDAENHAVDDGEDEKYERFKEWRDQQ